MSTHFVALNIRPKPCFRPIGLCRSLPSNREQNDQNKKSDPSVAFFIHPLFLFKGNCLCRSIFVLTLFPGSLTQWKACSSGRY